MDALIATYRLETDPADARARARALALEQTAEVPREALGPDALVGAVESIEAEPDGTVRATLAYPVEATAGDPAQILNVLLGNAAMYDDVRLVEVQVPAALAGTLGGPRHGLHRIRSAVGADARPMTCAALKPMGASAERLGRRCEALARAGIDVVKDDHGLADAPGCPLDARLEACLEGIERATEATGRRTLYAPNLIGAPATLRRGLDLAAGRGAGAVLVAPMLVGLPAFRELADGSPLPILAHPAFATPGIAPETLLGTLFRLYGADAVLFPHAGGRFPIDEAACRRLAQNLRRPVEGIRAALPVPAGGATSERVAELIGFYGRDTMLLAGGTLYAGPGDLETRARAFARRVAESATTRRPA